MMLFTHLQKNNSGFNIKIKEKLISDFSEFRDGFNHVRVGNFIIENQFFLKVNSN